MKQRSPWKLATSLLAGSTVLVIGCMDGTPTSTGSIPNLYLGEVTTPVPAEASFGKILVCKSGDSNISGTFTIVKNSGDGTSTNPVTASPGTCVEAANYFGTTSGVFSSFSVTEQAAADPANTTQSLVACRKIDNPGTGTNYTDCLLTVNTSAIDINNFHGYLLTYKNVFTPPPSEGCTFTQGYYKNHESDVVALLAGANVAPYKVSNKLVLSADGTLALTAAQVDANLETPPKGGNAFLILTHQLITAELNVLGGASVPAAVQTAINDARTLLNGGISASEGQTAKDLAAILDNYNNGITGPGHCPD